MVILYQILFTFWEPRISEGAHHSQEKYSNVVQRDMVSDFTSKVFPDSLHEVLSRHITHILRLLLQLYFF